MVEQARLEAVDSGLAPLSEGWFVVNVRNAAWLTNGDFGARCVFEANRPVLRRRPDLPRSELARRHNAGVDAETGSPADAYALSPEWQPDRLERWSELPWAHE